MTLHIQFSDDGHIRRWSREPSEGGEASCSCWRKP